MENEIVKVEQVSELSTNVFSNTESFKKNI